MRRRHLRSVLRIEAKVYPVPWSMSLFLSELALRSTRAYYVAFVGRQVVGYAGLMMTLDDGHVTTIAVDPRLAPPQGRPPRLLPGPGPGGPRRRGGDQPDAGGSAGQTRRPQNL